MEPGPLLRHKQPTESERSPLHASSDPYRALARKFEEDPDSLSQLSPAERADLLLMALQREAGVRSPVDIKLLAELTKEVAFFGHLRATSRIGAKVHEGCCRLLQYQELEPDQIVFSEHARGTSFWVLVKGTARIVHSAA